MKETSEKPHTSYRDQNIVGEVAHLKERKYKAHPIIITQDGRIFSFKYTTWRVLYRACYVCLAILFCYVLVFGKTESILFSFLFRQIFGGIFLQMCVFRLLDMIFTKEIILYPHKIAHTWRFGLRRDVVFTHSRFGAQKTISYSSKRFYPSWYSNFFTPFLGVFYDEYLVEPEDVRLMNKYLSEISGRDLSTFEQSWGSVSLKSFMKEANTHEQ